MSKARTSFLILLALGLLVQASAAGALQRKANARQLMLILEDTYEDTLRAAQVSGLDARAARDRPFWSALDRTGIALEDVGWMLRARDERFFQALERGSVALGELRVVWLRLGVRAPEVDQGIRLLSSSFRLLRGSYGAEPLRARQGGRLTAAERQRFERMQALHAQLAERLRVLQRTAEARRDRATAAEMARLIAESERIAAAPVSVNSYLNALIAGDEIRGEWDGSRYFADPLDRQDWLAANSVVEDLYVESEVGHVFAMDLGKVGGWSHLDAETEMAGDPGTAGGEVQVFHLAEDEEPVSEAPEPAVVGIETFEASEEEADDTAATADLPEDAEVVEESPALQPAPAGEILEEDMEIEPAPTPSPAPSTQIPPPA